MIGCPAWSTSRSGEANSERVGSPLLAGNDRISPHLPTRLLRSWERSTATNDIVGFVDELLRGVGQVMFQNSPISGLLFVIGLFVGGWQFAAYAILGTAASTLTARWLGVPAATLKTGLYGYNGTLAGVALAYYLGGAPLLPLYVVFASIVTAIVAAAIGNLLDTWRIPALSGPFVVTTGVFILGILGTNRLGIGLGAPAASGATIDGSGMWEGILRGVAQVFFQSNAWVGAIFLLGLLASSQIDVVMALVGSAAGLATGWMLGLDAGTLALGLMGYNAVLTMIALGGLYYVFDRHSFLLALIAAATSTVVTVALSAAVAPFGGHIYTAPFVVTTWLFIAARPFLHTLQAAPQNDAASSEGRLNLYRLSGHWWEERAGRVVPPLLATGRE
jgi:urea transporter